MADKRSIIFFDGHCNLCNGFVDFVIKRNKNDFYFASLQGETAKRKLDSKYTENLSTVVLLDADEVVYTKSLAAILIISKLGFPCNTLSASLIVPRPLRDIVYSFISKNRMSFFGRSDTCRIPTEEEKFLFLD